MIVLKLVDYNILYQEFTVQFIKLFRPRWSHKFLCACCPAFSEKRQAVFALVRLTVKELMDPSVHHYMLSKPGALPLLRNLTTDLMRV